MRSSTILTPTAAVHQAATVDSLQSASALGAPAASKAPCLGCATVIGSGPSGLAQAALLLKRAGDVGLQTLTVVERRPSYTRPVGLFFRTMTLDALRWLDAESFAELEKRSGLRDAQGAPQSFTQQRFVDGVVVEHEAHTRPEASAQRFQDEALDASRPMAEVADDLFSANSRAIITMRDLEEVLWSSLPRLAKAAGVTLVVHRNVEAEAVASATHPGTSEVVLHPLKVTIDVVTGATSRRRDGTSTALPPQGLVVLTEGSAARVRDQRTGTTPIATGPNERFLVAALQGGTDVKNENRSAMSVWHNPSTGQDESVRVSQGIQGKNGLCWTTVSVPNDVEFDNASADAHAKSVNAYFEEHAGLVGDATLPRDFGPGIAPICGTLVERAVIDDNTVLAGDAVGTSHFKSAGGAATGLTTHVASMHRFLDQVQQGTSRAVALEQLDQDLRAASLTWALHGLPEFSGDPWALREQFLPKGLLASLVPPHLVDRYWPAGGGAPTDPKSPWQQWFADAGPHTVSSGQTSSPSAADTETLFCNVRPAQAAAGANAGLPVTSGWDLILASAPDGDPATSTP